MKQKVLLGEFWVLLKEIEYGGKAGNSLIHRKDSQRDSPRRPHLCFLEKWVSLAHWLLEAGRPACSALQLTPTNTGDPGLPQDRLISFLPPSLSIPLLYLRLQHAYLAFCGIIKFIISSPCNDLPSLLTFSDFIDNQPLWMKSSLIGVELIDFLSTFWKCTPPSV